MKKAVGQMKNGLPSPGQDKDTVTAVQKVSECHHGQLKRDNVNIMVTGEDSDAA